MLQLHHMKNVFFINWISIKCVNVFFGFYKSKIQFRKSLNFSCLLTNYSENRLLEMYIIVQRDSFRSLFRKSFRKVFLQIKSVSSLFTCLIFMPLDAICQSFIWCSFEKLILPEFSRELKNDGFFRQVFDETCNTDVYCMLWWAAMYPQFWTCN